MSKEEVAAATKISTSVVTALEEGDHKRLPGKVFVVNFVRSYALAIGLEPEDTVFKTFRRWARGCPHRRRQCRLLRRRREARAPAKVALAFAGLVCGDCSHRALFPLR